MDCTEHRNQIVPLIKGHLGPEESGRLRRHLEGCEDCRREYEETSWLIAGMVDARADIKDGHVSSRLLYQYVQSPGSLDAESIELITAHVDQCERCQRDAKDAEQLSAIAIDGNGHTASAAGRPAGFWQSLFRRRLLPAYGAAIVVAAALTVVLLTSNGDPSFLIAQAVSPTDAGVSGHTIVQLANRMTIRGDDTAVRVAPAVISKSERSPVVLNIEAVTFEDENMGYSARIETAGGETIWETDLDTALLDSGRLWLLVDQSDLSPGVYSVFVTEHEGAYAAAISSASIEVVK